MFLYSACRIWVRISRGCSRKWTMSWKNRSEDPCRCEKGKVRHFDWLRQVEPKGVQLFGLVDSPVLDRFPKWSPRGTLLVKLTTQSSQIGSFLTTWRPFDDPLGFVCTPCFLWVRIRLGWDCLLMVCQPLRPEHLHLHDTTRVTPLISIVTKDMKALNESLLTKNREVHDSRHCYQQNQIHENTRFDI